ncbi:MAG: acyl-CoA dehydrogenase family protein [Acidimicrobiia bacterium]
MHLSDPATDRFRAELVAWLDAHAPAPAARDRGASEPRPAWLRSWQRTLFEAGWLVPTWSPDLGGRDASATQHLIYLEEMGARDLPRTADPDCLEACVPALLEHGTDEQVAEWVVPLLRGDRVWCLAPQGSAAGDRRPVAVAAHGDPAWLVSGTFAPVAGAEGADRLLCAAWIQHAPDDTGHRPTATEPTVFAVDLSAAGVSVREFPGATPADQPRYAVVLTRVPASAGDVIGEPGAGTAVLHGIAVRLRSARWVGSLLAAQRAVDGLVVLGRERGLAEDRGFCATLGRVHAQTAAARALAYWSISKEADGRAAPELAMLPLVTSAAERAVAEAALDALGPAVLDRAGGDLVRWPDGDWVGRWLASFTPDGGAATQHEAITDRVLGVRRA